MCNFFCPFAERDEKTAASVGGQSGLRAETAQLGILIGEIKSYFEIDIFSEENRLQVLPTVLIEKRNTFLERSLVRNLNIRVD